MITLSEVSKKFGGRTLFENVSVVFHPKRRYGLTGPNGAGKTTLLKMMMKDEELSSGSITLPEKTGILRQDIEPFKQMRVLDVVIQGNKRLWKALEERESLYEKEITDAVGMRLGELEEIIVEEDGYSAESEAEELLAGVGIPGEYFEKKMHEIPLDAQFKVLVCQALFGHPQALLLDEPTNHLDLASIRWLENFLFRFDGVLIVISHDRHFLNSVTTHIADIDYETVIVYPGNYDEMVVAKSEARDRIESIEKAKEKKAAQLKEFVARFGAGTRASQVQSRLREIEKLQPSELKKSNIQRPYIRFMPSEKTQPGKVIFRADGITHDYGEGFVFPPCSFEILKGDKVGVIGANGRGKTTLLRMLAQKIPHSRGRLEVGHQVIFSYFPQNHHEIIDKETCKDNLLDWLRKARENVLEQEMRSALGKMLFSGDEAFKKVATLSGGETARLILSSMMLEEHNTLILDEPNGHLDLESVSALGWGLNEYKGTVIAATHDRDLLQHFAEKLIVFEEKKVLFFDGGIDAYFDSLGS